MSNMQYVYDNQPTTYYNPLYLMDDDIYMNDDSSLKPNSILKKTSKNTNKTSKKVTFDESNK